MRGAGALGRHAAARQRLVAENIAQAGVPGALPRDLAPFAAMTGAQTPMRQTRAAHLGDGAPPMAAVTVDRSRRGPNGNGISLEAESLRAVRIEGQHRLAVAVYAKAHSMIRIGLGRPR